MANKGIAYSDSMQWGNVPCECSTGLEDVVPVYHFSLTVIANSYNIHFPAERLIVTARVIFFKVKIYKNSDMREFGADNEN